MQNIWLQKSVGSWESRGSSSYLPAGCNYGMVIDLFAAFQHVTTECVVHCKGDDAPQNELKMVVARDRVKK